MTTPTNRNDVFSSPTDSTPLTIIVPSVVGGVLGLFIIVVCILALIIRSRKRQSGVKIGIFKRYVCLFVIIMNMCDWIWKNLPPCCEVLYNDLKYLKHIGTLIMDYTELYMVGLQLAVILCTRLVVN